MDGISTNLFASDIVSQVPLIAGDSNRCDGREASKATWSYKEAFKRNRGLITEAEQEKLATAGWPLREWAVWVACT